MFISFINFLIALILGDDDQFVQQLNFLNCFISKRQILISLIKTGLVYFSSVF